VHRFFALFVAALLLAGCGSAKTSTNPDATAAVGATQDPAVATAQPDETAAPATAEPTAEPTVEATSEPTAVPDANVSMVKTYYRPHASSYGGGGAQVILEVKNDGGTPAKLSSSGFTVYAKNGDVVETGDFNPLVQFLAPGETGYLGAYLSFDTAKARKNVGKVVADDVSFESVDEMPACAHLKVARPKATKGSYGVWMSVSGVVTNDCGEDLSMGNIGAVMLDAKGAPLGWASDATAISDLKAGKTKGFKTEYGFAPGSIAKNVKKTLVFAYDYEF